jgi:hypothetical protein
MWSTKIISNISIEMIKIINNPIMLKQGIHTIRLLSWPELQYKSNRSLEELIPIKMADLQTNYFEAYCCRRSDWLQA